MKHLTLFPFSFILSLALFFFCFNAKGQELNDSTIKGTILSEDTNCPISYANIYFNKTEGTNSDKNGNFELFIGKKDLKKVITISAVGFKTVKISASSLSQNPNVKLKEDIFSLDEVVITPLNAFPILSKVSQRAKFNYKTGKVSSDFTLNQAILFLSHNDSSEMKQLAFSKIKGQINYKGDIKSSTKLKYDSIYETMNFKKLDALNELFSNKLPLNLYSFFNDYEVYRKIEGLKENNPKSDKNVFNAKAYKNRNISRVIDFEDIENRPHYVISTSIENFNTTKNEKKAKLSIQNEKFRERKEAIKESLKLTELYKNPDSMDQAVTKFLSKPKVSSNIDKKSYFWIDKEKYLMTKHLSKVEFRRSDNNQIFNKIFYGFTYKNIDGISVVEKIETLKKQAKTSDGIFFKYVKLEFYNHQIGKNSSIIPRNEVLDKDYNTKPIFRNRILLKHEIESLTNELNESIFIKPLKKESGTILDFYENYK